VNTLDPEWSAAGMLKSKGWHGRLIATHNGTTGIPFRFDSLEHPCCHGCPLRRCFRRATGTSGSRTHHHRFWCGSGSGTIRGRLDGRCDPFFLLPLCPIWDRRASSWRRGGSPSSPGGLPARGSSGPRAFSSINPKCGIPDTPVLLNNCSLSFLFIIPNKTLCSL